MSAAGSEHLAGVKLPKVGTYMTNREVEECKDEIKSIEGMLSDPRPQVQAQIEDRGAMSAAARSLVNRLNTDAPPETTPEQRDAIAKREEELLGKIMEGMPSKMEMRKCPPGAIGKHAQWEKRNKAHIIEWKNLKRLQNRGNDDPDISNLEMHRPTASTLNMDNAVIPGTDYFIPPATQAYRDGYDQTFQKARIEMGLESPPEASSGTVAELQRRLAELEQRLESASAKPAKERPALVPETAACGKECASKAGRMAHERTHKCALQPVGEAVE